MKRAEVGRFRIALNTTPDGAVVLDHVAPDINGLPAPTTMVLEPQELDDLAVALDSVTNDRAPDERDELRWVLHRSLQRAMHELNVTGLRFRIELRVEVHDFYRIVEEAGVKFDGENASRMTADLGAFRLVCERGRRL